MNHNPSKRATHRNSPVWFWSRLLLFFYLGGMPALSWATHNLAGQITAARDPNASNTNTYIITLTTYTDPAPAGVDRCSADIYVYDVGSGSQVPLATLLEIPRNNGPRMTGIPNPECSISSAGNGIEVKGTVKRNIYTVTYTFPGPGEYEMAYADVARHGSVVNIVNPTDEAFSVVTRLTIPAPILGFNNTPILLNEPLDDACIGKIWTHNPGAWDADGDSLSFSLYPSLSFDPAEPYNPPFNPDTARGYRFPDNPAFGTSTLTMDPVTGQITWVTPQQAGIYNFGYVVEEWRNGIMIGYVLRDLAVWVDPCQNNPPVIETITDTCVYAGQSVEFDFFAYDPDSTDSLYVDLNNGGLGDNGPFAVENSATLDGTVVDLGPQANRFFSTLPVATNNADNLITEPDTVKGSIFWQTECDNIRKQHYQVDLYATDNKSYNDNPGTNTLAAYAAVEINVIPPPPSNVDIARGNRSFRLTWDPTPCEERVWGYKIYRQTNGSSFIQDSVCCDQTPEQPGYQLIDSVQGWGNTMFIDSLLDIPDRLGDSICYAITAIFSDPNLPSLPATESCAADACLKLENTPLYIMNDSIGVGYTSAVSGQVDLRWNQPKVDSIFLAPYSYHIYRANNNGFPAILIATQDFDDTTYVDQNLDTEARGYNYRVEVFTADGERVQISDGTNQASTIFLEVQGGGSNFIDLTWTDYVPWMNNQYEVWRSDNGAPHQMITVVQGTGANVHAYRDENLNPDVPYCYFIRSIGTYATLDRPEVLTNDSQEACDFAQDDDPPCPPTVVATGDCETLIHTLEVSKSEQDCDSDAEYITLWFANNEESPFRELLRINYVDFSEDTTLLIRFQDRGEQFAGCYAVTITDSLGNTSELDNSYCVDYCPSLTMSNVFTPNGDGANDILRPAENRDVVLVEFTIFDRWGRMMARTTTDINSLWDGREQNSGKEAKEGTYYYVLRYEEQSLGGNLPRTIKGFVTLLR